MKRFLSIGLCAALATFAVSLAPSQVDAAIPPYADVMFLVDESGSMGGEHAWLTNMVTDLEAGLVGATVGDGTFGSNQYALVGFGGNDASSQVPHAHAVGGGDWGTAAQLSTATGGLVTSGGFEDGWNAINYALNNYTFRSNAALNIILITDEDRDNQNAALNYNGVLGDLKAEGALLNVVVNHGFSAGGTSALGVDSTSIGYTADGSGGFNSVAGGVATSGFGTTKTDYIDMAWATGGAAWDLNQLRAGGLTATSFTNAFVDIKVEEIINPVIPEPGTMILLGSGLVGLAGAQRRRKKDA